tara:strand:- start:332 stop:499 length:168 start_codon:yes stop_codon:yes gene_type:complete
VVEKNELVEKEKDIQLVDPRRLLVEKEVIGVKNLKLRKNEKGKKDNIHEKTNHKN